MTAERALIVSASHSRFRRCRTAASRTRKEAGLSLSRRGSARFPTAGFHKFKVQQLRARGSALLGMSGFPLRSAFDEFPLRRSLDPSISGLSYRNWPWSRLSLGKAAAGKRPGEALHQQRRPLLHGRAPQGTLREGRSSARLLIVLYFDNSLFSCYQLSLLFVVII